MTEIDLDFDVEITGFETAEIDLLIGSLETAEDNDPADEPPEFDEGCPGRQPARGFVWVGTVFCAPMHGRAR